jgi:TPP-dependent pyruvate/acetoin dehydrogenase alpha subunit
MQHASSDERSSSGHEGVPVAHRQVLRLRLLSARLTLLQRTEKIASHHACLGEEAAIVGAALGAREQDWLFPGVREWGAGLVRGVPIEEYVHHAFGSRAARAKGHSPPDHVASRKARVAPASGILGAHVPQAVGAAWAAKIKKDDVATLALFGIETTSTGDFHNAMNFAGVFKAPCVFVCRHDEGAAFDVAARAVAYGIASGKVDGMDAAAVQRIVRAAIVRAAEGKGPTLVAAITRPVTKLDDVALAGEAVLSDLPKDDAFVREVQAEIDAAIAAAEAAGAPEPTTIFDDVFATLPAHLAAQKMEIRPWRR